jgi:hypothetical protein
MITRALHFLASIPAERRRGARGRGVAAAAILSLLTITGCAHRVADVTGDVDLWRVRGAVVKVDDVVVHVRHKSGRVIAFAVDGSTTLVRGTEHVSLESLTTGRRVLVHARPSDTGVSAIRVELF